MYYKVHFVGLLISLIAGPTRANPSPRVLWMYAETEVSFKYINEVEILDELYESFLKNTDDRPIKVQRMIAGVYYSEVDFASMTLVTKRGRRHGLRNTFGPKGSVENDGLHMILNDQPPCKCDNENECVVVLSYVDSGKFDDVAFNYETTGLPCAVQPKSLKAHQIQHWQINRSPAVKWSAFDASDQRKIEADYQRWKTNQLHFPKLATNRGEWLLFPTMTVKHGDFLHSIRRLQDHKDEGADPKTVRTQEDIAREIDEEKKKATNNLALLKKDVRNLWTLKMVLETLALFCLIVGISAVVILFGVVREPQQQYYDGDIEMYGVGTVRGNVPGYTLDSADGKLKEPKIVNKPEEKSK